MPNRGSLQIIGKLLAGLVCGFVNAVLAGIFAGTLGLVTKGDPEQIIIAIFSLTWIASVIYSLLSSTTLSAWHHLLLTGGLLSIFLPAAGIPLIYLVGRAMTNPRLSALEAGVGVGLTTFVAVSLLVVGFIGSVILMPLGLMIKNRRKKVSLKKP